MSEAEVNARALAEGPGRADPGRLHHRRRRGRHRAGRAADARRVPVAGVHGRQVELSDAAGAISGASASTGESPILPESDVVIISVRDERIPEVAERLVRENRLRREQVLLHTSGANPSRRSWRWRGRMCAASARCTRWFVRRSAGGHRGAEPRRVRDRGRPAGEGGARSWCARWARGRVPRGGGLPLSRRRGDRVELRRRAGRCGATLLVEAGVPQDRALSALIPLWRAWCRTWRRSGCRAR